MSWDPGTVRLPFAYEMGMVGGSKATLSHHPEGFMVQSRLISVLALTSAVNSGLTIIGRSGAEGATHLPKSAKGSTFCYKMG